MSTYLVPPDCSTYLLTMDTGRATQTPNSCSTKPLEIWQEEGEFFYHCPCSRGYPLMFLRLSRSYMGKAGSDAGAEEQGARQPVFIDLPGLCADSPKLTGVASPEGSVGPELRRVSGVDLWRHLPGPFKGVLGTTQCTPTQIDS